MARLAAIFLALSVLAAGCGSDEPSRPSTAFASAVATAGGGVSPTGVGVGFVDVAALDRSDLAWAAAALGPGGAELLDDPRPVERSLGFDPASADRALAIASSYTLGLRLDGVPAGRLPAVLRAAGAEPADSGPWTTYDLGAPAEGALDTPLRPLESLGSRTAVSDAGLVFARDEGARASLIGAEGGELGSERIDLATGCLGDVTAARLVPRAFTHNVPASPDLIAFGVRTDGAEVLCAVDLDPEAGADRDDAMRAAFAPGARDGITGEPIGTLFASAEVTATGGDGGPTVTRAVLTRPPGSVPGEILEAFPRGSTLTYLGSRRPIPLGTGQDGARPRG